MTEPNTQREWEELNVKGKVVLIPYDLRDELSKYRWQINPEGYVTRNLDSNHRFFLHWHVLPKKFEDVLVVDHINGNRLDNRRENLRYVTNQQNGFNRKLGSNNKSGYKGVHWHAQAKSWRAAIKINGKVITIGSFKKIEDAVIARKEKEIELFGEYRNKSLDSDVAKAILQSYRQELRKKVEGMREYCHENNQQRGCLSCVRMSKQNQFVEDLLTIISE